MDSIVSLYASATGLWKTVAKYLPLVAGVGTLLSGVAGFCAEIGHAPSAGALLALAQRLNSDPNTALVIAGLAALGIHTNHAGNQAAIAAAAAVPLPNAPKP